MRCKFGIRMLLSSLLSLGLATPNFGVQAAEGTSLQSHWATLTTRSPLTQATVSAYAFDITKDVPLAAIHPDWRQTPASVTKLVTSAVALDTLGPNFRYRTRVEVNAAQGPGPIYLVGGGDPLLEADGTTALRTMARKVAQQVHRATQVVGVSSFFPGPLEGPGWAVNDVGSDYGAGTSALMVNRSEVELRVSAGVVGQPPGASLVLNGLVLPSDFRIVNRARTVPVSWPSTLTAFRLIGTNHLIVEGDVPSGRVVDSFLSVGHPAQTAAVVFQRMLQKEGVHFTLPPTTGTLPQGGRTIVVHASDTLSKDLKTQNQFSVNQMAENLARMVGVQLFGSAATDGYGRALSAFCARADVNPSGMTLVDGSGLSSLDEASARQVVQVLRYAATRPWFDTFLHSLMRLNSVQDGGILAGHPFALPSGCQVWLKTGNLSNQWNYAGYVEAPNGHLIAFAILDDGPNTDAMARVNSPVDQMVDAIATNPVLPAGGLNIGVSNPSTLSSFATLPTPLLFAKGRLVTQMDAHRSGAIQAISIVDTSTGRVVWHVMGSTILPVGLLTRLAVDRLALEEGPNRLPTVSVCMHGTLVNGVLNGWLTVTGASDVSLTSGAVSQIVRAIQAKGVVRVLHPLHVESTRDVLPYPIAMPWDDIGQPFAPSGAVTMVKDLQQSLGAAGVDIPPGMVVDPSPTSPHPSSQTVFSLVGPATAALAVQSLSTPSGAASFALENLLGPEVDAIPRIQRSVAATASFQDPTGLSDENYGTADSFAILLAKMVHEPNVRPVVDALRERVFASSGIESNTDAGYLRSPSGRLYSVVEIDAFEPWDGQFSPSIMK